MYFCFFKQNFERKKFSAYNTKLPVNIIETKTRLLLEIFYPACKHGFMREMDYMLYTRINKLVGLQELMNYSESLSKNVSFIS